jgi:hypothetical protein
MSGLLLTGAFSLDRSPIYAVGTDMVKTVTSAVRTADRPSLAIQQSFTYYIEVEYDINSKVLYKDNSSVDNGDDAYGLGEISVSNLTHPTPKLSLPSAVGVDVPAGNISATAGSGVSGSGSFPVTLTINLSSTGLMTSTCSISGSSVTASAAEDPTKAQVVHWPTIDGSPVVSSTTADKLSDVITAAELNTEYADTLKSINDNYNNINMLSAWSITIDSVSQETNNSLSKYAQDRNKAGQSSIFDAGQKIVCSVSRPYNIVLDDYNNDPVVIVEGTIYGVITQS